MVGVDGPRRLLDPDARRGFEIAGDAPVKKRTNVFEGVSAFARRFDSIERGHDVAVRYLVERLCPREVPGKYALDLVCGYGAQVGEVLFQKLAESFGKHRCRDLLCLVRSEGQQGTLTRICERNRRVMAQCDFRAVPALDDNPRLSLL